jgi:stage III sporulation protein AB
MGYKWIGAILIMASCSGCGFAIAAGKRREEQLLYQLIGILQFLEADLQYRLTPLPELCRLAAKETKGILRTVFLNLYRELKWQKLPDAGSCMYAAIQRSGEIPPKVRRLLVQLGHTLGRFDLPGQLQGIQSVRKRSEETLDAIRKNRDERLRSYQTLGICAGAALAIILI